MKFSIITPVYNGEAYIAETIKSVLSQAGDFEIEYIIMDGGSGDKTVEIAEGFKNELENSKYHVGCKKITMTVVSEKDRGMYNAINKGFARATGDIYAWINSDDIYLPDAFQIINNIFSVQPNINWVKGITQVLTADGQIIKTNPCFLYNQSWVARGIYGTYCYFIHQDSVFWRKELWQKAGPINSELKYAGDFYLWIKMAKFYPLWSIDALVSGFRKRPGQLSSIAEKYQTEQKLVGLPKGFVAQFVKIFFWFGQKIPKTLHLFLYRMLFIKRNRFFIKLDHQNKPQITEAYSYIATR